MDPISVSGLRLVVQMSFDLRVRKSHLTLDLDFPLVKWSQLQGSVEILR